MSATAAETNETTNPGARPLVLVCEDDAAMRELVASVISRLDVEVVQADSSQHALDFIENNDVALLVTDLKMPGVDGMQLLKFARSHNAMTQVAIITGYASVESAIDALKSGAFDYIKKPFDNDELFCVVERALEHYQLRRENHELREQNRLIRGEDEGFVGRSQSVSRMRKLIDAAAEFDCTVLITGESGCGKELVARQIHEQSGRRDKSFVAINCAAIPENIIESELFGYVRGAFTGAERNKSGLFEAADGGTLFLDEINNASLSLQAKLLRVLQDGAFYRMGDTTPRSVNVRVLAASNRSIQDLIAKGDFREDLYYRLKVIEIHIPALRERRDDIPLLVNHLVNHISARLGKRVRGVSTRVLGAFMRYEWPGNVRELENMLERMIILAEGEVIDVDLLPPEITEPREQVGKALDYMAPQSLEDIEAYFIKKTLRETGGDRGLTAEILGIDKSTLWRKIKRYHLNDKE
ncbi:sigma-54-dependent Fis family transcriptional regulator [Thiohalobacter sp. COW1]|uniref:sigma-54-dependent transcriptional regulator n=1 Tax=Thiohalobacter sp. COW1 TaxID=2795687 RepID=UPI00191511C7|nr:sigma-54 dependent transcriptional regulator [Thiohalobacter sp. COW1]BCO32622.1 sigma-54-dependent Fis family transcriptional regulator [Thiohalobacter sp. COW1]